MKVIRSGSAIGGPYRGGTMRVKVILDKMDIKKAVLRAVENILNSPQICVHLH